MQVADFCLSVLQLILVQIRSSSAASDSPKPYISMLDETANRHSDDPPSPPPENYLLHSINATILIRQLPSLGIAYQLWPAAATLVSLLDRQTESAAVSSLFAAGNRRLRLLELGSGTGLVGIAAAALLGASVTVTDLPRVLPNLRFNADANAGVVAARGGEVRVAALSWGDAAEMGGVGGDFDVVLASDVVYHDHLFAPLLETLRFLLARGRREREAVLVMAHLKRWKKESAFFNKARKYFHVEVVHRDSPINGGRVGVNVYKFVTREVAAAVDATK